MTKHVVIAGYGYLGKELARLFLEHNFRVTVIKRTQIEKVDGINFVYTDICDLKKRHIPQADLAFYLLSPDSFSECEYDKTFVKGISAFCNALNGANVEKIIFSSSTSVYEQKDGSIVNEKTKTNPKMFPGKKILEGEKILESIDIDTFCLRFSGIYGPGRDKIVNTINKVNNLYSFSNRIHKEDACKILFYFANNDIKPGTYIATDCLPEKYINIASWLKICIKPEHQKTKREISNKRLSNAKLLSTGYKFIYPSYREGFQHIKNQLNDQSHPPE